jgi:predicted Rdx family selenoprotein
VRGGRGDFIVVADGETLWDKKKMGGFPDDAAIAAQLSRR